MKYCYFDAIASLNYFQGTNMEIQIMVWGVGMTVAKIGASTGVILLTVRDGESITDYRIDGAGQQLDIAFQAVFMTHYLPVPDASKEQLRTLNGTKVAIKSSKKVTLGTGSTEISVSIHPYNIKPIEIISSIVDEAMGVLMPAFDVLGTAKKSSEKEGKAKVIGQLSGPASPTLV